MFWFYVFFITRFHPALQNWGKVELILLTFLRDKTAPWMVRNNAAKVELPK